MLLFHYWLHFLLDDDSHSLIENTFKAFLGQSTAFHVFALELFLNDFPGCFFHDGSLLGVFLVHGKFLSQVDLVANKDLGDVADILLELGVPLSRLIVTFLRALTKEEGSTTEKTMRKTSQLG